MTTLKPFFTFFGGKYRLAPRYPAPIHRILIEPFAGSAGYAVRHHKLDVRLYDADPVICGVWDYLINASAREISRLPLKFDHVDEIPASQEAKWLVGFWLNKAMISPCLVPGAWMRSQEDPKLNYWGEGIRSRLAHQVEFIRHWTINNRSYQTVPNRRATWFVDPPYNHASGKLYRRQVSSFRHLARWCRSLRGQLIVCEREGATWLPFVHFHNAKALEGYKGKAISKEVIWTQTNNQHVHIRIHT